MCIQKEVVKDYFCVEDVGIMKVKKKSLCVHVYINTSIKELYSNMAFLATTSLKLLTLHNTL